MCVVLAVEKGWVIMQDSRNKYYFFQLCDNIIQNVSKYSHCCIFFFVIFSYMQQYKKALNIVRLADLHQNISFYRKRLTDSSNGNSEGHLISWLLT